MSHAPRYVLFVAALSAATLLLAIIWSAAASPLSAGMSHLLADRWGITTLIDIYVGAVFVATWMLLWERNRAIWALWVVGLVCLGHLVTMIYLLRRAFQARDLADVFVPPALRAVGPDNRSV